MSIFEDTYNEERNLVKVKYSNELFSKCLESMMYPPGGVVINGWNQFNTFTGGLRMHEFTILCGSTGSGKTTLCANIAYQLLVQKVKFFVCNVETGPIDFMRRIYSISMDEDWNTGDPIPEKIAKPSIHKIDESAGVTRVQLFRNNNFILSNREDRATSEEILEELKYCVDQGVKIAIIDNLNFLLEVVSKQNELVEMDRVTHDIIMFCKENPIHLIMVMHPRKTISGRVESEFDIKGSSTAVQEAHNVLLFNRPLLADLQSGRRLTDDRELKIAKLRRKGKYTGETIVFKSTNGVKYEENRPF
jgi:replicative DNA helicase